MSKLDLAATFPSTNKGSWTKQVEATLNRGQTTSHSVERLGTKTLDGIKIEPIYETPLQTYGRPKAPINHSSAYWDIVQRVDISDNNKANEQMLTDLLKGATGISLVLSGSVSAGHYGLPSHEVVDFKQVSQGVELDLISVRLDAGANWQNAAQNLLQVYTDRNLDLSRCALTFGADPISAFALTGCADTKDMTGQNMAALLAMATKVGHTGVVFSADGRVYHDAGASEAQELGFAIASCIEQLRLLEQSGVELAIAWPRLGMILSADREQFSTIAKFRAAHLLWEQLQGAMKAKPCALQLDAETSGRMMSVQDPYVNMLRTTSATFAAGIGGVSSLAVLPFSIAIGSPDAKARRMARNAQLVLQEESSIGLVGDVGAGSGYIESFTNELAQKAWQIMQEIEANGGMMASLVDGKVQGMIEAVTAKRNNGIAKRKQGIIGVSEFANLNETPVSILNVKSVDLTDNMQQEREQMITCLALKPQPISAKYEALRKRSAALGNAPVFNLVTLGKQDEFAARATWATNLFAAGGIAPINEPSSIACICSTDEIYAEQAAEIAQSLKTNGCKFVYLAGHPRALEENDHTAIDGFLHVGCNILETLQATLDLIEGEKA